MGAAPHVAVGHAPDRERLGRDALAAREQPLRVRAGRPHVREDRRRVAAERAQAVPADHQADVGRAVLDRLQPGIAVREEGEVHGRAWAARRAEVGLQADEVAVEAVGAGLAAQVVLAGRKDQRVGGDRLAGGQPRRPPLGARDRHAPPDLNARRRAGVEHRLVERAAGQRGRAEGQGRAVRPPPRGDPRASERHGAEGGGRDAQSLQLGQGLAREELAADLIVGPVLALDQRDGPPAPREGQRGGAAREAAPDDQDVGALSHASTRRGGRARASRSSRPSRPPRRAAGPSPPGGSSARS